MAGRRTPEKPGDPRRARRGAIAAIRLYQLVRAGRPSPCRYWPTCSEYAREAFGLHGFWHGAGLTARRLLRCRPGAGKGWDPVPPPATAAGDVMRRAAAGAEA